MTTWSELHDNRSLISRKFFSVAGTQTITAPAGSAYIRASAVGAGGYYDNGAGGNLFGGGAAFARVKTTCAPADQFSVQVGDIVHAIGAGDAAGDSKVTKVSGSVVILKAERGKGTASPNKGLASNSTGDVKRDGENGGVQIGGASGSDSADTIQLGFGGRPTTSLSVNTGHSYPAAGPGGGGSKANRAILGQDQLWNFVPGPGLVCVEFFKTDPGY